MNDINLIPTEYKRKGINLGAIFSKTGGIVLVLIILSLLVGGGLFLYQKKLNKNLNELNKKISDLELKRDNNMENVIYSTYKKLGAVETLFNNHIYWSKVFSKIEELVIDDVQFMDTELALANDEVGLTLNGRARTYTGLARQMISFKEDKLVGDVKLSDIRLSETGGIEFTLVVTISQTILLKQTENK